MKNEIVSDLIDFKSSLFFFQNQFKELKKKYPDKFILIENKEVKLSNKNLDKLVKNAREEGIDTEKAFIDFVPKKENLLLL